MIVSDAVKEWMYCSCGDVGVLLERESIYEIAGYSKTTVRARTQHVSSYKLQVTERKRQVTQPTLPVRHLEKVRARARDGHHHHSAFTRRSARERGDHVACFQDLGAHGTHSPNTPVSFNRGRNTNLFWKPLLSHPHFRGSGVIWNIQAGCKNIQPRATMTCLLVVF